MPYQELIQHTLELLSEESVLLSEKEDVEYFRDIARRNKKKQGVDERVKIKAPLVDPSPPQRPETSHPPQKPTQKPETTPPPLKADFIEETRPEFRNAHEFGFSHIRGIFKRTLPSISILDDLPDDAMAKKIANRWKTKNLVAPISILYGYESEKQKELLNQIVKAINTAFGPAQIIDARAVEKEKQWDAFFSAKELKLVISSDYTLWQLRDLMAQYKEHSGKQTRLLKNTPLFLLPDLSLYLKDPLLKRSLWKALCKVCRST